MSLIEAALTRHASQQAKRRQSRKRATKAEVKAAKASRKAFWERWNAQEPSPRYAD